MRGGKCPEGTEGGRTFTFMEVCGTHTVAIFRSGLRGMLPPEVKLLSGPGCPVCVTTQRDIDAVTSLARAGKAILSYGDMLRVPGRDKVSLADLRGVGADVRVVTNAMQCVEIADETKNDVVFFGVGFETTAPATAVLLKEAARLGLDNFFVYSVHKTVPQALTTLRADGFLLPGNVAVIIGTKPFCSLAREQKKPCVVVGFEPEKILAAIRELHAKAIRGESNVVNFYPEAVREEGNVQAMRIMNEVFASCDAEWRGLGMIKNSGLEINKNFEKFDAKIKFNSLFLEKKEELNDENKKIVKNCQCGKILTGQISPPECPLFGKICTPATPVGACMVSSEGTCGAWFRWNR